MLGLWDHILPDDVRSFTQGGAAADEHGGTHTGALKARRPSCLAASGSGTHEHYQASQDGGVSSAGSSNHAGASPGNSTHAHPTTPRANRRASMVRFVVDDDEELVPLGRSHSCMHMQKDELDKFLARSQSSTLGRPVAAGGRGGRGEPVEMPQRCRSMSNPQHPLLHGGSLSGGEDGLSGLIAGKMQPRPASRLNAPYPSSDNQVPRMMTPANVAPSRYCTVLCCIFSRKYVSCMGFLPLRHLMMM